MTVVITGCIIAAGLMIRRHYDACGRLLSQADALFATTTRAVPAAEPPPLRRDKPTAIFLVGGYTEGATRAHDIGGRLADLIAAVERLITPGSKP